MHLLISLRKSKEDIRLEEEREFTISFVSINSADFNKVRKQIKEIKKWNYKGADHKSKVVRVGYRGQMDSLSDEIEEVVSKSGVNPGTPEFVRGRSRIIFGQE